MTLASNRSLAEGNLLFQPRLDERKARLTQKYQELQVLFEAYQLKKTKLGNPGRPWGRGAGGGPRLRASAAARAVFSRGSSGPGRDRRCEETVRTRGRDRRGKAVC